MISTEALRAGAADWLCLAATPSFAAMAVITSVSGGGQPDILCSAAQDGAGLGGMVPMYLLMSAFHSAPWLKLLSGRSAVTTKCRRRSRASLLPGVFEPDAD